MKTKKHGNITLKEYMQRWKEGMLSITPLQKAHADMTGFLLGTIGLILALVTMLYINRWYFTLFIIGIIWMQWAGFKKSRMTYFEIRNALKQLEQNKIPIKEEEGKAEEINNEIEKENYKKLMEEMSQE